MKLKERARRIKLYLPTVYLSLKDSETPAPARILAALTVAYALSPIDLIPDFIPILGLLDDLFLLPFLITITVKLIPKNVWERHLEESKTIWNEGRPKRWRYAIPVLLIWIFLLAWITFLIVN